MKILLPEDPEHFESVVTVVFNRDIYLLGNIFREMVEVLENYKRHFFFFLGLSGARFYIPKP